MAIVIILIIAFWFLDLPVALQVLMTVFGSLYCVFRIVRAIIRAVEENNKPQKTGYDLLDRFIK